MGPFGKNMLSWVDERNEILEMNKMILKCRARKYCLFLVCVDHSVQSFFFLVSFSPMDLF